ncbi:fatty acid desaturase [Azospirillum halopraeferens]|uniref:fatty acid desaturase n=1 Tax=Azospirillum halopraeferens TaxID=34010 RepID=UPI000415F25B|nr:fatty acid desaturase [Azospirillum halopraeferens]
MLERDTDLTSLRAAIAVCQQPIRWCSAWQVVNSFIPFFALCAAMYASLEFSYWLTLALAIPAAGFVVRIFIIQHDCGHGSFFRSRRANDALGMVCSLITLTPYFSWRRQHAGHHANWNNLDRRLSGLDIYSNCLTVREYKRLSRAQRLAYRISRHPAVSFVLIPPLVFLLLYRFPFDAPGSWRKERLGVHLTNLALLALVTILGSVLGFQNVLMVHLPIMAVASIIGVWLFSLQHRFEDTLWARRPDWNHVDASLRGSSHLNLPKPLQWFTGNIGFHHVHHLSPHVPNYRLEECHNRNLSLRRAPTLTLWSGLKATTCALWDEDQGKMVGFRSLRRRSGGAASFTGH